MRGVLGDELGDPLHHGFGVVLARHVHAVLAVQLRLHVGAAQDGGDFLLDEFGLAFLEHEDRLFVF